MSYKINSQFGHEHFARENLTGAVSVIRDTVPASRQSLSVLPGLPRGFRAFRHGLTALTAASVMFSSIGSAAASRATTPSRDHRPAVSLAYKPAQHLRHERIQPGSARVRSDKRAGVAARDRVVVLANTTWDNPAISPAVLAAILDAGRDSGIAPNLLMTIAWRESRFDPTARSSQSSASGLLQFTSGTWLQTVRAFGARHGAGVYAAAIHREPSGEFTIHGQPTRETILALRSDPALSASMAAEVLGQQRAVVQASLGRCATSADLYLFHVLGPSGSARFLSILARHPSASIFSVAGPKLLRNGGLLARDGGPMTVRATYAALGGMLDAQHVHPKQLGMEPSQQGLSMTAALDRGSFTQTPANRLVAPPGDIPTPAD